LHEVIFELDCLETRIYMKLTGSRTRIYSDGEPVSDGSCRMMKLPPDL